MSSQPDEYGTVTGWWAIAYTNGSDQVYQIGHSGFRDDLLEETDRLLANLEKASDDNQAGLQMTLRAGDCDKKTTVEAHETEEQSQCQPIEAYPKLMWDDLDDEKTHHHSSADAEAGDCDKKTTVEAHETEGQSPCQPI
eukprot:s59_g89.t1